MNLGASRHRVGQHRLQPTFASNKAQAMATDTLITAEQFCEMPDHGVLRELVRDEVIEINPPGFRRGAICAAIARSLGNYVVERKTGRVTTNDAGIITRRNPDSVRGADVAYYSYQRIPADQQPARYPARSPELVFEVLSSDDRWSYVLGKVSEYLAADVQAVCVVDPAEETITVYTPEHAPRMLTAQDTLELPGILPGFQVRVAELLAQ